MADGGGVRRALRAAASRLHEEQRAGTISLVGLPRAAFAIGLAALIAFGLAAVVLIPNFLGGWWPGPVVRIPGGLIAEPVPGRVSVPLYGLALGILALACVTIGVAVIQSRSGWQRIVAFALLGLTGVAVGGTLASVGRQAGIAFDTDPAIAPIAPTIAAISLVAVVAGIAQLIGLVLGPLLAELAKRWSGPAGRRLEGAVGSPFWAIICGVPFGAALAVVVLLAGRHADLGLGLTEDPRWPGRVEGVGIMAGAMKPVVEVAVGLVGVLFLWQSVVAARALRRELGVVISARVARRPKILFALLGAKAVWLIAGYAGVLTVPFLAGSPANWEAARQEDPAGLLVAALLVAGATWWLVRPTRPQVSDRAVGPATAFFAIGFYLPTILASAVLLLLAVTELWAQVPPILPDSPELGPCLAAAGGSALGIGTCVARVFTSFIEDAGYMTWVAGLGVAVVAWLRGRRDIAIAFGAVLVWALPIVAGRVANGPGATADRLVGRPELLTLDALLTIVIAVLAILWWRGRQAVVPPRTLALVLVVSTLVAAVGGAVPSGQLPVVVGLLLVGTALYELLFDSASVNEAGIRRAELLPRTLGLQLLGFGILATSVALDQFSAEGADLADFFVPPVIVILVAAEISRRRRSTTPSTPRPARSFGQPIRWAGAGAIAIALVVVAGRLIPAATPGPSDAERYRAFLGHVDVARVEAQASYSAFSAAAQSGSPETFFAAAIDLSRFVDVEVAWLESAERGACFGAEFDQWAAAIGSLATFRDRLFGPDLGPDLEPDLETPLEAYIAADTSLRTVGTASCQTVLPGTEAAGAPGAAATVEPGSP